MSLLKTFTTSKRVLSQLRHDPRTLVLVLLVPSLLIALLRYVLDGERHTFDTISLVMLGIFPLTMMFLITSIATLRERKTGTLDRLMTMPISKLDFIFGYAVAFSLLGLLQACLASWVTLGLFDVPTKGGAWPVLAVAVLSAFLGTALGLLTSAFASTEFQAVQMIMPFIFPQVLLCGAFVPRDSFPTLLHWISDILPLTYSIDAMQQVVKSSTWTSDLTTDLLAVLGFGVAALIVGSLTIKRQE